MYYLKCGFLLTIIHVDGKFSLLQAMKNEMTGGLRVNLASAIVDVPEI